MARLTIPFPGARQVDSNLAVNGQRSINWFPELEGNNAKAPLTLKPTPGKRLLATPGTGPMRSQVIEFQGRAVFVSGSQLVSVDSTWTETVLGTLTTGSGWCEIVAGRTYVAVVDGVNFYAHGMAAPFSWGSAVFSVVTRSTDANYDEECPTGSSHVRIMNGYFMVNEAGSDAWSISANENPLSWNGADFGSAEVRPDNVAAIETTLRDVYTIGTQTTEVYYQSDNADFPFERYPNGLINVGVRAPNSVATDGNSIFMVGAAEKSGPSIFIVQGFQAQKIADPDLADTIDRMTVIEDAVAYVYTQSDQTFYVLTFPSEDITFAYHLEQGMWHERRSGASGRDRGQGYGYFNGEHVVGDYQSGSLYALDRSVFTENGATIIRTRRGQIVHREGRQIEMNSVECEFKRGIGLTTGQGSDPEAMMRYTNDGYAWSRELRMKTGKIGEYGKRAIVNRLGTGLMFGFEVSVSDPIDWQFANMYVDVEVLSA